MSSEPSHVFRDLWWTVFFSLVLVGITTSNEYMILAGLLLMLVSAMLTYAAKRIRTRSPTKRRKDQSAAK